MYFTTQCGDQELNQIKKCSAVWVLTWLQEDLTACATDILAEGCATIPEEMAFTAPLHLKAAFEFIDTDGDGVWSQEEMNWLIEHRALSRIDQWEPKKPMYCDTDESELQDGSGFSGDLTKEELHTCWAANVPSCHVDSFETNFETFWSVADDGDDVLSAEELESVEVMLKEVGGWPSDENDEECPVEDEEASGVRRLLNNVTSFLN